MKKNVVLIGMPGSGKSTIGRLLSGRLNKKFIDLDEEIESYSEQTIPDLFKKGETHFREIESVVTAIVSRQESLIIATGGGVILREENMGALRKKGLIIFLDRHVEHIADDVNTSTRPLLKDGLDKLHKLYDERYPLYKHYADIIIKNNDDPDRAIEQIMLKLPDYCEKGQFK